MFRVMNGRPLQREVVQRGNMPEGEVSHEEDPRAGGRPKRTTHPPPETVKPRLLRSPPQRAPPCAEGDSPKHRESGRSKDQQRRRHHGEDLVLEHMHPQVPVTPSVNRGFEGDHHR